MANLVDLLISGILAFIMFSVGLSLRVDDFRRTFAKPRAYLIGLGLQLLLLPAIAFLIAWLAPLPPAFAIGIIILATTPGGMTSNFISYLVEANTALAVSLTVSNSLAAMITIPVYVNIGLVLFLQTEADLVLPFWATIRQILLIVIVPVILGVLMRRYFPRFAEKMQPPLKWITMILLAALFVIKFFADQESGGSGISPAEIGTILPWALLLNAAALAMGYVTARILGLGQNNQVTLAVEIGILNTSLAFVIAGTLLGNEDMLKPALVYALFSFVTALGYALLVKPGALRKLVNL